jgi:ATP-dependent DNA helicase RecQ
MFGLEAEFREDQYEAIERIVNREKLLLVEKTGWGKSIVYFIATKILRNRGMGPTILISPLISLMRNQVDSANRLGLNAMTINSSNDDKYVIYNALQKDECDILLISPERLSNREDMEDIMNNIHKGIGMFVVDEAHCISDWGHDFRPDYRRIINIVRSMPPNVPILATTATANERVINDIVLQLGDIKVMRGSLMRESLKLQVIKLRDQSQRLAWLAENIPQMPGNGIVYCLTVRDTERVAEWLRQNNIDAVAYTGKSENRIEIENAFMQNEIKCLVATVALGMGYDKPDIGFVIHYQRPGNIVSYYQQIGRAGRQLDTAYAILLSGKEDDDIQEYFIRTAFPTEREMVDIVDAIENADDGISKNDIMAKIDISWTRLKNCLKYLMVENVIERVGIRYYRTTNPWSPDEDRSKRITRIRYGELDEMREFVDYDGCYMEFLAFRLDDRNYHKCGRCANCTGKGFFSETVAVDKVAKAQEYIRKNYSVIEPRWKYPDFSNIPQYLILEKGMTLCDYGDAGWGQYIPIDKYKNGFVRTEIVEASVELIAKWLGEEISNLTITYVPSLRQPGFVRDFAVEVANRLHINCVETLVKTQNGKHQKELNNSVFQYNNAYNSFECPVNISGNFLLIDDMVDSRWTFSACGIKLKMAGAAKVYPFAIASTAGQRGKSDGDK